MKEKLKQLNKLLEKALDDATTIECWGLVSYLENMIDDLDLAIEEYEVWLEEGKE